MVFDGRFEPFCWAVVLSLGLSPAVRRFENFIESLLSAAPKSNQKLGAIIL